MPDLDSWKQEAAGESPLYGQLSDLITDALALAFKLREMQVADQLLDALRTLHPPGEAN